MVREMKMLLSYEIAGERPPFVFEMLSGETSLCGIVIFVVNYTEDKYLHEFCVKTCRIFIILGEITVPVQKFVYWTKRVLR